MTFTGIPGEGIRDNGETLWHEQRRGNKTIFKSVWFRFFCLFVSYLNHLRHVEIREGCQGRTRQRWHLWPTTSLASEKGALHREGSWIRGQRQPRQPLGYSLYPFRVFFMTTLHAGLFSQSFSNTGCFDRLTSYIYKDNRHPIQRRHEMLRQCGYSVRRMHVHKPIVSAVGGDGDCTRKAARAVLPLGREAPHPPGSHLCSSYIYFQIYWHHDHVWSVQCVASASKT